MCSAKISSANEVLAVAWFSVSVYCRTQVQLYGYRTWGEVSAVSWLSLTDCCGVQIQLWRCRTSRFWEVLFPLVLTISRYRTSLFWVVLFPLVVTISVHRASLFWVAFWIVFWEPLVLAISVKRELQSGVTVPSFSSLKQALGVFWRLSWSSSASLVYNKLPVEGLKDKPKINLYTSQTVWAF